MLLLPDQLIEMHCRDRNAGIERDESEVLAFFHPDINREELERRRLWERLDEEVESRGGCEELI